ncbi:chromosome partitioning protein [Nesterenkonia sp.]|uniref:AAA family ATPase n=1 Tax=Nesterenkonia sp. TaxID=704201 RepID=UPI002607055E|nr:chromosome partitioning protein [Nesterenkonia sp.]
MQRCSVLATGQLETDHVTALERLHTPVTVDRRCADLAELIAAARTYRADAVLLIGSTEKLTASVIAELLGQRLRVVVISDAAAERDRLAALGAVTCADSVEAEALAQLLAGTGDGSAGEGTDQFREADHRDVGRRYPAPAGGQEEPAGSGTDEQFEQLMESSGLAPAAEPVAEAQQRGDATGPERGLSAVRLQGITAVWGAAGSPGRTTVAVNLAAELALTGARTLLVDADTYAASVAVHLGLMEESAGLAQACRAAEVGRLDSAALASAVTGVTLQGRRLDVLTGLPRPERWTELRPHGLQSVLTQARADYQHIVVDIAPWIEPDAGVDPDSRAPQRNAAARTVLGTADTVLTLGSSDPVGFSRLIKSVQQLGELLPEAADPTPVVTQLRRDVVGRSPRGQLAEAWQHLGPAPALHAYLAWDPASCAAALRAGQVLAEAAEDSPLRRQIAALAGIEIPPRRRLRLRLPSLGRTPGRPVESTVSKR